MRTPGPAAAVLAVTAACVVAAPVAPAGAATVGLGLFGLIYDGQGSENNVASVSGTTTGQIRFADAVATLLNPGGGCSASGAAWLCPGDNQPAVTFRLGTGDDQLQSGPMVLMMLASGDAGTDVLFGGYGDDTLSGGVGNDTTHGAGGADRLVDASAIFGATSTEGGADTMLGEGGDDTLVAGAGPDTMDGGTGSDTADYGARTAPVAVTVDAGSANDGATGEGDDVLGVERILGGSGADALTAGATASVLVGAAGDDTLGGGAGADLLNGGDLAGTAGSGNDTLDGGGGPDELRGGDGVDTASYATRTAGVTVSPDDVADDGQAGELDNVRSDVETLLGGAGDDVFRLRDDRKETVACGPGNDAVVADAADVVATDCEQVDRPAAAAPGPGTGTTGTTGSPPPVTPPVTPPAALTLPSGVVRAGTKGRLVLRLRCSAGIGGCAGRLVLRKGPRTVAAATYLLAAAKAGSLTLTLPPALRRVGARLTLRAVPVIGTAPTRPGTLTLKAPARHGRR